MPRGWQPKLEEDSFDPDLLALYRESAQAWETGDVEWLCEHAAETLEIRQPQDLLDARTYTGPEGLLDAVLDWPLQWEKFEFEPTRIFAIGPRHVVTVAIHRGRAHGIEVEAELSWLQEWRERQLVRWDMFTTVAAAVTAARER